MILRAIERVLRLLPYAPFTVLFLCTLSAAVDFNTLDGKVMTGYQGWHWAKGDRSDYNLWHHWSQNRNDRPGPSSCHFDIFPDMSEYSKSYNTDFYRNGVRFKVYSSQDYSTVDTHFRWMKEYNIDGAFVQRFLRGFDGSITDVQRNINTVLGHCQNAAEAHGRAYVVMYDVSSSGNNYDVYGDITADWNWLNNNGYINSNNYLHHNGKPVVAIWGMGFNDRFPETASEALSIVNWFKNTKGCHVMGGVPENWRTFVDGGSGASRTDPAWLDVYEAYDVISPWMVGRVKSPEDSDSWLPRVTDDVTYAHQEPGREYMPVVSPGFSWSNWNGGEVNQAPRLGGQFLWRQAHNAKKAGANMIYLAMFDEVDEGTAIYKIAETINDSPDTLNWVTADIDGYPLPSDWYLQVSGQIKEMMTDQISNVGTLPILVPYLPPVVDISGAPPGNISNAPYDISLTATSDFGYYSINDGPYIQIPADTPAIVTISGPTTIKTYGNGANGISDILESFFTVDMTPPTISIIAGPDTDHIASSPFNVLLQVDEDYGYWSLNGGPYNQIALGLADANPNSGFELGNGAYSTGWSQSPSHTRDAARVHSGIYALRSTYRGTSGLSSSTSFSVTPNTDYTLSAWIWKDDNNSQAYVDMNDLDGEASIGVGDGIGGGVWTYISEPWNSGSNTQVTLRCVQDGGNITGDMIWDDVKLTAIASTAEHLIDIFETSTLSFYSEDSFGNSTPVQTINYTITDNRAPVIDSTPPSAPLNDGDNFSYTITATDPDGDSMTFSAPTLPTWLSFDAASGILSGVPTLSDVGVHLVTLSVSDGVFSTDQDFSISISSAGNDLPEFTSLPGTNAYLYQPYSYIVSASDLDGDSLSFSAPILPFWLSFDPVSRTLSGTPYFGDEGGHSIVLRVDDGSGHVDQSFTLIVGGSGNVVQNGSFEEGTTVPNFWTTSASAYSMNSSNSVSGSNSLAITSTGTSISPLTQTVTLEQNTTYNLSLWVLASGMISGPAVFDTSDLPDSGSEVQFVVQAGDAQVWTKYTGSFYSGSLTSLPVRFFTEASFNGTIYYDDLSITPQPGIIINSPPIVTSAPVLEAPVGVLYTYYFTATDSDGDALTYGIVDKPFWAQFYPGSGLFRANPSNTVVGDHPITLSVSDGTISVEQSFTLTVVPNQSPYWLDDNYFIADATEGEAYTVSIAGDAVDPEGANLYYSKTGGTADWLSVASNGSLSGTPGPGSAGLNTVVVQVTDNRSTPATAIISINVLSVSSDAYEVWKTTAFTNSSAANTGRMDDFDGDGKSNEYEFMFGMDPEDSTNAGALPPHVLDDNGAFCIVFNKRNDGSVANYYIDTSSDMVSWNQDQILNFTELSSNTNGDIDTVTYRYNMTYADIPAKRVFVRVRAEE